MQQGRRSVCVRLEITSIVPGGDGIAHVSLGGERRAVFVARGAPGDILECEVDFARKPARAGAMRLLHPSSMRGTPPCPFAERCGGCDLMHLTLPAQREVHQALVRTVLERAIRAAELPPIPFHAATGDAGYRSRARLAIASHRGRAVVGYRRASSRVIEDVARCHVLEARLDVMLSHLRELFTGEQGEGDASVALGAEGRPVLDLRWAGDLSGSFYSALSTRIDSGAWAGAEVWLKGAREPARMGDPRAVTVGADGEPLIVPSGGFAQAHTAMNEVLGSRVLTHALPQGSSVVELFAGSGNFTVLLARHAASLVAVESDARAAAAARANLAARGLSARIVQGDADAFHLPQGTRTIVLDPPRAGAVTSARRIAASKARRIVYVSCDLSTLARDVAILVAGPFRLSHVEMFEMFPHTSHVEVLAILDRVKAV